MKKFLSIFVALCSLWIVPVFAAPSGGNTADLKVSEIEAPNIIHRVDTIATLRSMAGGAGKKAVQVMGYYAPGDGGGGPVRLWDAASTCTDDGGACIDPVIAGAGRWVFLANNHIDILWYGAKNDMTTDTTPFINAAVAAIATPGEISFPPGKYKILTRIVVTKNDIVFRGAGGTSTQFRSTVAGFPTLQIGGGTSNIVFRLYGIGFQYDGSIPAIAGTKGIYATKLVSPSRITDLSVQKYNVGIEFNAHHLGNVFLDNFIIGNYETSGVLLSGGVQGVWINNGKISARNTGNGPVAGSIGLRLQHCSGVYIDSIDSIVNERGVVICPGLGEFVHWIFFNKMVADGNTRAGIDVSPAGGTVKGVTLSTSWSSSNGAEGLIIRGSAGSITDGVTVGDFTAINNGTAGIELSTASGGSLANISVANSKILSNNKSNTSMPGIGVSAGTSGFSLINIHSGAMNGYSNLQTYGIRVYPGASDNYIISNCMLIGNVTGGISDGGTGLNKSVAGNIQ